MWGALHFSLKQFSLWAIFLTSFMMLSLNERQIEILQLAMKQQYGIVYVHVACYVACKVVRGLS